MGDCFTRMDNQTFWGDGDAELFRRFAADAQAHQIGERRLEKYRTDLTIAHTMTGLGMLEMVEDAKQRQVVEHLMKKAKLLKAGSDEHKKITEELKAAKEALLEKSIEHLKKACVKINNDTQYSFETKRDAKRTIGSLFCFIHYNNRSLQAAPLDVRVLFRHEAKGGDKRLARAILTREEIREFSKRAGNIMDKAIIWLLFESGMRNGEFEQLKKSDITIVDEGLVIKVPAGKTGERMVIVVEATKYVKEWLAEHPMKAPDAPLWYYVRRGWGEKSGKVIPKENKEGALTQAGIAKRIRNVVVRVNDARKKAGIPLFVKDVNPHNFRHSRASELGGEAGMTEAIMCKFFGWEIGSTMPKVYLHITDAQVQRAVLRTFGKAKPEEEVKIITHWTCSRCKDETPMGKNYCGRCGASRDGKVLSMTEKLQAQIDAMKKAEAVATAKQKETDAAIALLNEKLLMEKTASTIKTKRLKSTA